MVKPIPDGYHTLTPYLRVRDGNAAVEFYKKAFGAEVKVKLPGPDGKGVMHAELKMGDSLFMLSEECKEMNAHSPESLGGTGSAVHVYVKDVDAAIAKAAAAGAKVTMPAMDMFWGDRFGKISDPFGHEWSIATHKEDVPADQMPKRAAEAMKQMQMAKKK